MDVDDLEWRKRYESLRRSAEENPQDGGAWFSLGKFLEEESDNPNLAIRAYERAAELWPDKDLRLRLGRAYVMHGESEKGLAMIRASAEEQPRVEAYCFLAHACLIDGRTAEAEVAAAKAIELEPSFAEAHYLLGESLEDRDRAAAIESYRTAVSLDDHYALAWQALGRELMCSGEIWEGVEALRRAVAIDTDDVWSQVLLANGLWKLGLQSEADAHYRAAVALSPEFPELRRWYREFLECGEKG